MISTTTILIVDDETQIRRVLRAGLSSQGYEILEAETGEEAIETVLKQHPDLVLLDVNMPGMGGIETCRRLRSIFPLAGGVMISFWDPAAGKIHTPEGRA